MLKKKLFNGFPYAEKDDSRTGDVSVPTDIVMKLIMPLFRAGLKGRGVRGNFHWRAPMTYFMTSSFVKFTFSLICNILVCFFQ